MKTNKKYVSVLVFIFIFFLFGTVKLSSTLSQQKNLTHQKSSELGFSETSPFGKSGGSILPASCESGAYEGGIAHWSGDTSGFCNPPMVEVQNPSNGAWIAPGGTLNVQVNQAFTVWWRVPNYSPAGTISCGIYVDGVVWYNPAPPVYYYPTAYGETYTTGAFGTPGSHTIQMVCQSAYFGFAYSTVYVNAQYPNQTLTIVKSGPRSNTGVIKDMYINGVQTNGANINCGNVCTYSAPYGSQIRLDVTFGGTTASDFSGCTSNDATHCWVTMTTPKTVGVNFGNQATLTVNETTPDGSTIPITSNPAGLSCANQICTGSFNIGYPVTLTLPPGNTLANPNDWIGCDLVPAKTNQNCYVTLTGTPNQTVNVAFSGTITLNKTGSGASSMDISIDAGSGLVCGGGCTTKSGYVYNQSQQIRVATNDAVNSPINTSTTFPSNCPFTFNIGNWYYCNLSPYQNNGTYNFNFGGNPKYNVLINNAANGYVEIWAANDTSLTANLGNCQATSYFSVPSPCYGYVAPGSSIFLRAVGGAAYNNSSFIGWETISGTNYNAVAGCLPQDGGLINGNTCRFKAPYGGFLTPGPMYIRANFAANSPTKRITIARIAGVDRVNIASVTFQDNSTNATLGTCLQSSYDCSITVPTGTAVKVTLTPTASYTFNTWDASATNGCRMTTANPCVITVSQDERAAAAFNAVSGVTKNLSVTKNGTGTALVTSTNTLGIQDLNCGGTCTIGMSSGLTPTYTITANLQNGSTISSWVGCDSVSGTGNTVCTKAMTGSTASNILLSLNSATYTLSVTASPWGDSTKNSAQISSNIGGIICATGNTGANSTCTSSPLPSGTIVNLSLFPTNGLMLSNWTNCTTTTGNNCQTTVDSSKTATANLVPSITASSYFNGTPITTNMTGWGNLNTPFTWRGVAAGLDTNDTGSPFYCKFIITTASTQIYTNSATQNCFSPSYSSNRDQTLNLTPSTLGMTVGTAYYLSYVASDVSSYYPAVAPTMRLYIANPTNTLTVTKSGSGGGTIISDQGTPIPPVPPTQINCGSVCSSQFENGAVVNLFATSDDNSLFTSWTGCDSVNGNQCTVTVSSAKNVSAAFTITTVNGDVKPSSGYTATCNIPVGQTTCSINIDWVTNPNQSAGSVKRGSLPGAGNAGSETTIGSGGSGTNVSITNITGTTYIHLYASNGALLDELALTGRIVVPLLTANPTHAKAGSTTTLTPDLQGNTSGCNITSDNANDTNPVASNVTTGGNYTVTVRGRTKYTVVCTDGRNSLPVSVNTVSEREI